MSDTQKLDAILKEIGEVKHTLLIIDKRLTLIENRLSSIEPWISVDNKHLEYKHKIA
jgi:hypothetical protein